MAEKFKLEIFTPQKIYEESLIDSLSVRSNGGLITILPHHIEYMANVDISVLSITNDGKDSHYAVGGGLIRFKSEENKAILVLHSIESVNEIDINKVMKEKEEAEERLKNKESYEEQKEAELAVRRALNMITAKNEYKDQG